MLWYLLTLLLRLRGHLEMADKAKSSASQKTVETSGKVRGLFPRIPLRDVLVLPQMIWKLGDGEKVRRLIVFDRLEREPGSGSSRTLITNSNGYGLTEGGYQADFLSLTERGKKLVGSSNERDTLEAKLDALFENSLLKSFVDTYDQRKVPEDDLAVDYFYTKHNIPKPDAKVCWEVMKSNLEYAGLITDDGGRKVITSRDVRLSKLPAQDPVAPTNLNGVSQETENDAAIVLDEEVTRADKEQRVPRRLAAISPQVVFNIQVVIPENASSDAYDAIFRSIGTHLLGNSSE